MAPKDTSEITDAEIIETTPPRAEGKHAPRRSITPQALPEGLDRELLVILIEECAEVQQRATKALRFGLAEAQPGQDKTNLDRLSLEVGDLAMMIERCQIAEILDPDHIRQGAQNKAAQLDIYLQSQAAT